jgi:hypothetical protein
MKALKFVVFGFVLFLAGQSQAQVSVRLNFGTQPQWAPVGYNDVRYYYLPDVEAYYDVQSSMFIYSSGNRWIHRRSLPSRYRNYDLYGGYKVAMNGYRGSTPYSDFNNHRTQYAKGYRGEPQRTIGERPGKRNSKNMKKNQGRGNDNR